MNPDYTAGRQARKRGDTLETCPHGWQGSKEDDTPQRKQAALLVRRHWWLAGHHDQDMEMMG